MFKKKNYKKYEFNHDKSLIDSIIKNLNPNNINFSNQKNKKNKSKSNIKKDKLTNKNSKKIFVINKMKK